MNYRGVRPATIVYCLEGNGSEAKPYQNTAYVLIHENIAGITRQTTVGKIVELSEKEKGWFNKDK